MKNMWDSSEVFTAYATIDAGRYMFSEILKQMEEPISPINKMIDDATGLTKAKHKKWISEAIGILKSMIAAKKVIEADYSKDEEMMADLKMRLKNINKQVAKP